MREIKFRGMGADGKMYYGRLSQDQENSTRYYNEYSQRLCWNVGAAQHNIPVSNETLGQYTGLKDKNGEEIYEGDQLKIILDGETYISPVMNRHGCWVIYHPYRLDMHTGEKDYINFGWWTSHDNVEVISNIYETPELSEE